MVCSSGDAIVREPALRDYEYGVPGLFTLRECRACGQHYLSPRPKEKDLPQCYPLDYHGYQTRAISRLYDLLTSAQMRRRFARYHRLLGSEANVLDVGCGDGYVLKELKKRAPEWQLYGVEFKEEIARSGQEQGFTICYGTLEECAFSGVAFDLLIMNHLIEHLPDPLRTLKKAQEMLKPGGYIIGEVPNYDSWDRRVASQYWGGHHTPRHLFQFTPKTLAALFTRAGLSTVRISPELHTGHWAGSVQNFLQNTPLKTTLRNGRAPYYPLLLALFVPINILQALLGKTGIMSFIAKKPLS